MTIDDVIDEAVAAFNAAATELDGAIEQMIAATTPTTDPTIHAAHIRLANAFDARQRSARGVAEADGLVIQ